MKKSRPIFLLVSSVSVLALFFISVAFVYHQVYKPSKKIIIKNIVLSDEVAKNSRLTGTVSTFPHGTRQVFVFFDFEKAEVGSSVTVSWFYGEKEIRVDNYRLDEPSGYRSYCLLKEDGSPLPKGGYFLRILQGNVPLLPDYAFNIY